MGIGGCWAGKSKDVRAFFAPGARALRRASLDGRSRKLLTPLRGWILNWRRKYEWLREVVDQSEHSVKREMSEVKERRSGRRFLNLPIMLADFSKSRVVIVAHSLKWCCGDGR
jgi:hypothetical protein